MASYRVTDKSDPNSGKVFKRAVLQQEKQGHLVLEGAGEYRLDQVTKVSDC